jgi:hypothetical protein
LLTVLMIVGVLALGLLLLPWERGGRLTTAERVYLFGSPLPILLVLFLPGAMNWSGSTPDTRSRGLQLTEVGLYVSGAMMLIGVGLIWQRRRQGRPFDPLVPAGLFLAAIPLLMVAIIALLFGLLS